MTRSALLWHFQYLSITIKLINKNNLNKVKIKGLTLSDKPLATE